MLRLEFLKRIGLLFYFIFLINSKKIVFPFKEIAIKDTEPNAFYNQILSNNIYTKIKIGKPDQLIIATFNSDKNNLMIKDIQSLYNIEGHNTYDYSKSKESFKNISSQNEENILTKGYSIINETIKLYGEKEYKNIKEINNFQLELFNKFDYNNESKTLSAEIGLKNDGENISFIKQLLTNKIISSEIISIIYSSDNEGNIYLGENPYNTKDQKSIKISNIYDGTKFQIDMDFVYIKYKGGRTFYSDTNLAFNLEQGVILASDGYQMSIYKRFFEEKINKDKCHEEEIIIGIYEYTAMICKSESDIVDLPSLYFEINNIVFTLDYKDLFQKVDDKYYFLIVFSPDVKNWILGKPFLKKYQLTFDIDNNEAYFYNKSNNGGGKSSTWVVVLVVFIIIIILAVVLYALIKIRNKRHLTSDDLDVKGSLLKN